MKKVLTLCVVCNEKEVLLGLKKRGFGEGRWNGFGGKVEEGESIEEAAARELEEESGLRSTEMNKAGILEFSFENDSKIHEVHIFKITTFAGEPMETEEMKPEWFAFENIPYDQMWSDDKYWLPLLLSEKRFKGSFLFDRPSDAEYSAKILNQKLFEVDSV